MHLEQSGYHNQILHQITQGVCLNEGHCERDHREDTIGYDLNLLKKPLGELWWFQELQDKIKAHTSILCVMVLVLEVFKLVSTDYTSSFPESEARTGKLRNRDLF